MMRLGQTVWGCGGRAGGRESGGSVKAGRQGGEKPRWQSQREPPDRDLGIPQAPWTRPRGRGQTGPTEGGRVWTEGQSGESVQSQAGIQLVTALRRTWQHLCRSYCGPSTAASRGPNCPLPASVSKFWNSAVSTHICIICGYFHGAKAELSISHRNGSACKVNHVNSLTL